jgi:hypothetical protein
MTTSAETQGAEALAESVFTSEGGSVPPSEEQPSPVTQEIKELMAELRVRYNGGHYFFQGYRYDRLEDAVAYARLERGRASHGLAEEPESAPAHAHEAAFPVAAERSQMQAFGVSFEAGRFVYKSFRYDRLKDALAYARLDRARGSP